MFTYLNDTMWLHYISIYHLGYISIYLKAGQVSSFICYTNNLYDLKELSQSMQIYLYNCRARFHPDLIYNNGAWGFFKEAAAATTRTTARWVLSSDVGSVAEPNINQNSKRERERYIYKSQETWLFMMARRHLTPIWMSSFKSPKFHFVWKDLERCGRDGRLREEPRCNEFTTDFEVSKEPLVESFNLDRFHITTRMCDRAPPDGLAGSKLWS